MRVVRARVLVCMCVCVHVCVCVTVCVGQWWWWRISLICSDCNLFDSKKTVTLSMHLLPRVLWGRG